MAGEQLAGGVCAVHARHTPVHHHDIGREVGDPPQAVLSGERLADDIEVVQASKDATKHPAGDRAVVDDEHPHMCGPPQRQRATNLNDRVARSCSTSARASRRPSGRCLRLRPTTTACPQQSSRERAGLLPCSAARLGRTAGRCWSSCKPTAARTAALARSAHLSALRDVHRGSGGSRRRVSRPPGAGDLRTTVILALWLGGRLRSSTRSSRRWCYWGSASSWSCRIAWHKTESPPAPSLIT